MQADAARAAEGAPRGLPSSGPRNCAYPQLAPGSTDVCHRLRGQAGAATIVNMITTDEMRHRATELNRQRDLLDHQVAALAWRSIAASEFLTRVAPLSAVLGQSSHRAELLASSIDSHVRRAATRAARLRAAEHTLASLASGLAPASLASGLGPASAFLGLL